MWLTTRLGKINHEQLMFTRTVGFQVTVLSKLKDPGVNELERSSPLLACNPAISVIPGIRDADLSEILPHGRLSTLRWRHRARCEQGDGDKHALSIRTLSWAILLP